jgi:hypothetical protein
LFHAQFGLAVTWSLAPSGPASLQYFFNRRVQYRRRAIYFLVNNRHPKVGAVARRSFRDGGVKNAERGIQPVPQPVMNITDGKAGGMRG